MSPYKKFLAAVKEFFGSYPALKVVFSLYLVIFIAGGIFFLLGSFLLWGEMFVCIGTVLMLAGLLLTLFNEDMIVLVFTSGAIALFSSVVWILRIAGVMFGGYGLWYYNFSFSTMFYAGLFGFIAIFTAIKSKKFHESLSAMGKSSGVPCPNCGAPVVPGATFCANCGAPAPAPAPYAPPAPPQAPPQFGSPYAPPAPQYAPPVPPQYAPPAPPQPAYAPQFAPQYAPPAPPQPAPQPAPAVEPDAAAPAITACANCGAELPAGAMFCGKCGAKQQ